MAVTVGQVVAQGTASDLPTHDLGLALGCLVSTDFVQADLKTLGLRLGDVASVRFQEGSIPGMEPTPGLKNIAIYDSSEQHGWLLRADHDSRGFVAIRNAYQLTRTKSGWQADEGFGGQATYAAMRRFASTLFHTKVFKVKLVPTKSGCRVEG
jgi:hypothetical protein